MSTILTADGDQYGDDPRSYRRREVDQHPPKAPAQPPLQLAVLVISITMTVFSVGYNWRRIDDLTMSQTRLEALMNEYMRSDVAGARFTEIMNQLQEIKARLK